MQGAETHDGLALSPSAGSQTAHPIPYWTTRTQSRVRAMPVMATQSMGQSQTQVLGPIFERLQGFTELEPNWDAYGAAPTAPHAIEGARALLEGLCQSYPYLARRLAPYSVAPIADGGVQLEWRDAYRKLQVEVRPDRTLAYLLVDRSGPRPRYTEVDRTTRPKAVELIAEVATAAYSA